MNLIIILSVLTCLASVTAQDSSDLNLTIDESSQTDISQITISDEDYKTESVERIDESSANEQNSSNLQNSVSVFKSSADKLGVSIDNEILGNIEYQSDGNFQHEYSVTISQAAKNYLSHYQYVSSGWTDGNHDVSVFWTPVDQSGKMYVFFDEQDGKEANPSGNKLADVPGSTITYTLDVATNVDLGTITGIDINHLPKGTISFDLNRKGSRVVVKGVYLYLETNTNLRIDGKLSEKIELGETVNLTATVKQASKILGENDGEVWYYVLKPGASKYVKLQDTSAPGNNITFLADQEGV